jgi:hypothetical protein
MTMLTPVTSVLKPIRFQSIDDIDQALASALEVASESLETHLQTCFKRWTGYEVFRLTPTIPQRSQFSYKWRLSNGFVDQSQPFTVKIASLLTDFTTNTAAVVDVTSQCNIQYEKGLIDTIGGPFLWGPLIGVTDSTNFLTGNFVRIDYTSGFNETNNLYGTPAPAVPKWLQNAAAMGAINHIDKIMPTLRSPKGGNLIDHKAAASAHSVLIERHIRYYPKYDNPEFKNPG